MRDQVLTWLEKNVSEHRLQHILGVEQMSIQLATYHKVCPEKAAIAGLMHDLAKFFKPTELLKRSQQNGIEIDEICRSHPHLLHADVSAIIAQEQFGVTDPDILTAIRNHTLGSPEMDRLSCILFVADALEPNRGNTPELTAMRQVAWQDLYKSVHQTCDYSLKYLLNSSSVIHPRTILTRNWALKIAKQQLKP